MNNDEFKQTVIEDLATIKASLPHKASKEEVGKVKGLTELNKGRLNNHKYLIGLILLIYIPMLVAALYPIIIKGGR